MFMTLKTKNRKIIDWKTFVKILVFKNNNCELLLIIFELSNELIKIIDDNVFDSTNEKSISIISDLIENVWIDEKSISIFFCVKNE